jgi:hypothetical protein
VEQAEVVEQGAQVMFLTSQVQLKVVLVVLATALILKVHVAVLATVVPHH